jgi:NAD-dependent deacetylase
MTRAPSLPDPNPPNPETLREVRRAVESAGSVIVLTGAGVSAESGVPTFRDRDGIWSRFDPEELATPEGFSRNPEKVWEWYSLRRRTIAACSPNAGHSSLARLLLRRPEVTLVTQNVDGLHELALAMSDPCHGSAAEGARNRIMRLHGSIWDTTCSGCGVRMDQAHPSAGVGARGNPATANHSDDGADRSSPPLPTCGSCGGLLRPGVVWFGEALDSLTLDASFEAARRADLCIVAGTSAMVYPAAGVPLATLSEGGQVVEVNPHPTPLTPRARWSLRGPSGTLLPAILD